jgi:hypothetical protein
VMTAELLHVTPDFSPDRAAVLVEALKKAL